MLAAMGCVPPLSTLLVASAWLLAGAASAPAADDRAVLIARVATSMKFSRDTFDTNGKLLEARRLHSMTLISLSFAMN